MKRNVVLGLATLCFASAASAGVTFGFEDSDDHHYFRSTGLTSFEVRYSGEIELSPDQEHVVSIAPGGFLEIETRRLFTLRKVRVTPNASGAPEMRYWRADRRGSEQDGRAFLERRLPDVARVTAVGARAQARRLFAAGGPKNVLAALGDRDCEKAHEIYLETILDAGTIDTPTGMEMIRDARRQISGSSRLSRFLVRLARKLPPGPELTGKLARACDEISSSSARREAIAGIADARGVPPPSAEDFGLAVSGISSSSEKASAIEHLAGISGDPRVISRLAEAAETIESSAETRRALVALLRPELTRDGWISAVKAASRISSSAEKASFLVRAAAAPAIDSGMLGAYLECAGSIDSSSEKRRALIVLLRRGNLASDQVSAVTAFAEREISSSSEREAVLREAANRKS